LPGELARAPRDLGEHIRQCASCQRLIQRVARLEENWRQQPVPASVERSQAIFLQRLAEPPTPIVRKPQLPRRNLRLARWMVAACVVAIVGLSIGVGVFSTTSVAHAEPADVIDRMIDWNLQLSEAPTLEDRQRLFAERAETFKVDVAKANLSESDRVFADNLMETGAWLAANTEPVEEADKLTNLADQIVTRAQTSGKPMDEKKTARFVQQYQQVAQHIEAKVEKAEAVAAANPAEHAKKLEKIEARENKRLETLARLQEKMPEASKKEIKAMIEQEHKKHKPKPKHPKGKG
jgi:hypothetical protein